MTRGAILLWFPFLLLAACSTRFVDYGEGYSARKGADTDRRRSAVKRSSVPRNGVHVVRKGETLYSIAWQYGLDYRTLASRNGIRPPYTIYPGQKLRLRPAATSRSAKSITKAPSSATAKTGERAASAPTKSAPRKPVPRQAGKPRWQWPAAGKVISRFHSGDPRRQGIDIAGRAGSPVRAAADGKVVYSGNGLRGYGNLVIIKHNDIWFSAYAHNRRIRVREKETVKAGQTIADMGSTGTDRVKLHFEIRRNGKPVDPLRYLPPEG